jgi:hypothetical protein
MGKASPILQSDAEVAVRQDGRNCGLRAGLSTAQGNHLRELDETGRSQRLSCHARLAPALHVQSRLKVPAATGYVRRNAGGSELGFHSSGRRMPRHDLFDGDYF